MNSSLNRALALVVDGEPIEWEGLLEDAADEGERVLLVDLRGLVLLDQASSRSVEAPNVRSDGISVAGQPGVGHRWGNLELLDEIGQGAYSTVHRAWDTRLAREVALKLLADDPGGRSLDEARRLARVSHPNVVTVYGADRHDGRVGLWMELLNGRTLDRILAEQGPFSARETIAIGLDMCSAVAAIHAAGLVHRDIKAQNVMRQPGGRLVVMDLGASVDVPRDDGGAHSLAGTPLYMAPELFQGARPNMASDVYAIGVLLYRLATGEYPLKAKTIGEMRRAHAAATQLRPLREARPDLPRAFVAVVECCLAQEPGARYPNVARLEQALHAADGQAPHRRAATFLWPLIATAVAVVAVSAFVWSRPARSAISVELSAEEFKVAQGFEELGASLGAKGDWRQAAERYIDAERIYRLKARPDAAIVAEAIAKVAFAQAQAGDLDRAKNNYQLAISKFQSNFTSHPLLETALAGLATVEQSMGHYEEAARDIEEALRMRARVLLDSPGRSAEGDARMVQRLAELGRKYRIDRDEDGDWIPDLLEAAIGSNPHSRDSDGNGVSDGDESPSHDGATNFVRFGIAADPSSVIAQYGAIDPQSLGFRQPSNRPFVGVPVKSRDGGGSAWKVPSEGQALYYLPLTGAQRAAAMSRGWRLMTRGHAYAGIALASVDFTPEGPRFDLNLLPRSQSIDLQLNTSVVPYEGITHRLVGSTWPLTQLEYLPETQSALLIVNGTTVRTPPYRGHRQFQEGLGFFFGSFSEIVNVPRGDADFDLAMFVIR